MRKLALALAGLLAFAANAQNLTKTEEGHAAVAICYATCMARGETLQLAAIAKADRLTDLLLTPQFLALPSDVQQVFVDDERESWCLLAQTAVQNAEACQVGCVDLEQVYDVSSSHARTRFREALREFTADLREAGLWTNYRTSPDPGTPAFTRACNAYLSDGSASGSSALLLKRVRPEDLAVPKQAKPNSDD